MSCCHSPETQTQVEQEFKCNLGKGLTYVQRGSFQSKEGTLQGGITNQIKTHLTFQIPRQGK